MFRGHWSKCLSEYVSVIKNNSVLCFKWMAWQNCACFSFFLRFFCAVYVLQQQMGKNLFLDVNDICHDIGTLVHVRTSIILPLTSVNDKTRYKLKLRTCVLTCTHADSKQLYKLEFSQQILQEVWLHVMTICVSITRIKVREFGTLMRYAFKLSTLKSFFSVLESETGLFVEHIKRKKIHW